MAIEGIDNLISTYSRVENTSIVQTLVMYKLFFLIQSDLMELIICTMKMKKMKNIVVQVIIKVIIKTIVIAATATKAIKLYIKQSKIIQEI